MKKARPPIVTVLGHVDHGKTTLLDAIRKTHVAEREAGGITQAIGATQVITKSGKITFVDTPGHATFSKMRARGAAISDIAILVVAASEGVMPQTKEALSYILENEIAMIVAFTKMDLPSANIDKVISQLEQEGVYFEGRGGTTSSVSLSATKGEGIEELLELIELLAGVNEVSADSEAPLEAVIIETKKDKRGTMVSVVVKEGTLKIGDEISTEGTSTKVKGLFGSLGEPIKSALPGDPVAILGFSETPEVGALVHSGASAALKQIVSKKMQKVGDEQLALVVKAQSAGPLEALLTGLPKDAVVLSASIGEVTESDIFFAKTSKALVVAFEAKVPSPVKKLADTEGVEIASFSIIYELFEFIENKIQLMRSKITGKAEVLDEFPYNRAKVAGCKIIEGRIQKSDTLVLVKDGKEMGEAKISSMRRGKNDLVEAKVGEECGIILSPSLDFAKGDILVATKAASSKR